MANYAHPEVLVDTGWVKSFIGDSKVRIVEVDYDPTSNYDLGHIPSAGLIDWRKDINDPVARDIVSKSQLEHLLGRLGVTNDMKLVLYGDFNNWFAAFAFWVLKYYGVENLVLMNGGRKKWLLEELPLTKDVPSYPHATFHAKEPDDSIRVYLDYVREAMRMKDKVLVDVRGPKELSGGTWSERRSRSHNGEATRTLIRVRSHPALRGVHLRVGIRPRPEPGCRDCLLQRRPRHDPDGTGPAGLRSAGIREPCKPEGHG